MTRALLPPWKGIAKPVIGMVHLAALPGSPRFGGDLDRVRNEAVRDAAALASGGVHGVMIENFGDVPFFRDRVPAHTISHMTAIAAAIRQRTDLPLGINVLRNDGLSALAVASAVGASFIRVNVLSGARITDQGVIQGISAELLRYRRELGADDIRVLADVDVKHSAPLGERPIEDEVADTIERGLADAVIVSGAGTGQPTDLDKLRAVKEAAGDTPVLVGSGITAQTIARYAEVADGFIVGTTLKKRGRLDQPVDVKRVRELMRAL